MTDHGADGQPPTPPRASQAVEFLRVVQQHHIQLSSMADFKANVLLGASLLIFGASIKQVHDGAAGTDDGGTDGGGAVRLAGLLALLPLTSRRPNPNPNILFFGVFSQLDEEDFQSRIGALLADEKALHRAMTRDIYQLGWVLRTKKYKRLGQAYRVFFVGLMASGLALAGQLAWPFLT